MHTIGVLLLAAATAGDGFGYDSPDVGLKKWLRPHAVVSMAPPGRPTVYGRDDGRRPWRRGHGSRRPPVRQTKSQIYFLDPDGMHIGWQTGTAPTASGPTCPLSLSCRLATTSIKAIFTV